MTKKISSHNPMLRVLEDGISGIHESKNIPARLWRIVIYKIGLTGPTWHVQLDKWQDKLSRRSTTKKLASVKGNITRMLADPKISWDALLRGLAILEYEKMDIQITLYKRGKALEIPMLHVDLKETDMDDNGEDMN